MEDYIFELLYAFAVCLGLTVLAELTFAALCHVWNRHDLWLVALVNAVTNPWVVYLYALATEVNWEEQAFLPLEIGAIATEAVLYRRYSLTIKYPWLFAAGANIFSVGIGYALSYWQQ